MLQGKQPLAVVDERRQVIEDYVEKFSLIAGRALTPAVYDIYVEALDGIELRRLKKGLKQYLKKGTRWPWPGDLLELIEEEV